ncbi:MAG TPA: glycosyltransferase family 2 protein [Ktedonobacteraceae bacterium]|nr:glycosyltransferase family 2 protein [Ktedonobacteraceae bacterium]
MPNPTIHWPENQSRLPKITIVTPCYNNIDFIEATIVSVLEQGYPNLEYIVTDGGSTDGSVQVIKRYAPYLAYWQSQLDKGQYAAINEGFQRSTGEIMSWLNAEDMLQRNALWSIAEIFGEFPQVEWLKGYPSFYDSHGRLFMLDSEPHGDPPRWSRYKFLKDYHLIQQESVFWRRSLWEKAGNYLSTDYALAGDLELWSRFFYHAQLYSTQVILSGSRFPEGQRATLRDHYLTEAATIMSQQVLTPDEKKRLRIINFFDRFLSLPLRKILLIRKVYEKLYCFPPEIVYDVTAEKFFMT